MVSKDYAPKGTQFATSFKEIVNSSKLSQLIETNELSECQRCNKSEFGGWRFADELIPEVVCLATLNPNPHFGYTEQPKHNHNASQLTDIDIRYYPYNGCYAYKCSDCHALFLVYLETGGHTARWLARLVRR